MIKQYRKKPVVIEAIRVESNNELDVLDFITNGEHRGGAGFAKDGHLYIKTLEGNMKADLGDYIIKGVKGEFYPVKSGIFHKTYEEPYGAPRQGNYLSYSLYHNTTEEDK